MLALGDAFYSILPPFKLKWQTARCSFTYRAAAISENNALPVKAQCWRFGWEIVHRAGGNNLHSLCRVVAAACLLLASFKSANDFFSNSIPDERTNCALSSPRNEQTERENFLPKPSLNVALPLAPSTARCLAPVLCHSEGYVFCWFYLSNFFM